MINSFGIILTTLMGNERYYMIVNKGCTHQYVDIFNERCPNEKVYNYVRMCSPEERNILKKYSCREIYQDAWMGFKSYEKFCERYNNIRDIIWKALFAPRIQSSRSTWGFPKGRKKSNETMIETASREFVEEIGVLPPDIVFTEHIIREEYIGTDNKQYRNSYIICTIPYMYLWRKYKSSSTIPGREYKISNEIREIKWITLNNMIHYLPSNIRENLAKIVL